MYQIRYKVYKDGELVSTSLSTEEYKEKEFTQKLVDNCTEIYGGTGEFDLHFEVVKSSVIRISDRFVVSSDGITTYKEAEKDFYNSPKEKTEGYEHDIIKWLADQGKVVTYLSECFTPSEYAAYIDVNEQVSDEISLKDFDEIFADNYNLWNYPLEDADHVADNKIKVVLVKFADDTLRMCEIKD